MEQNKVLARVPKDIRDRVRDALRAGWEATVDGKGHTRIIKVGSGIRPITIPFSPSDHRWQKNLEASMRKAGI